MSFTKEDLSKVLLKIKNEVVNGNTTNIDTIVATMSIRCLNNDKNYNPTKEEINEYMNSNSRIHSVLTRPLMEIGQKVAKNPTPTAKLDADLASSTAIEALQRHYMGVMRIFG